METGGFLASPRYISARGRCWGLSLCDPAAGRAVPGGCVAEIPKGIWDGEETPGTGRERGLVGTGQEHGAWGFVMRAAGPGGGNH